MADYDVIVIGSGPGGYVCAIRCAQLGLKTACVEGRETLGGTCLNIGCIPSKAMLYASDLYHESQNHFETMGLVGGLTVDLPKMQTYKQSVVDNNTKGIEFLFKKNKIDWLKGWGKITAPGEVSVDGTPHKAKTIVIATGSEVTPLRGVTIDEKTIVSSTGALALAEVPKRLVVVGAGVIGLELGSVYSRLGAEVTVLEFLDQITPGMDLEVCKTLQRLLTKQGLSFVLGAAVQSAEPAEGATRVTYKLRKDDSEHTLDADVVLVATGRRPYIEGVGVTELGVVADVARPDRGRRALADLGSGHLRARRCNRRPDAGAQGRGRGHGGGRDHRRPAWARELWRDPERHLHLAGGGVGRADRGAAQGGGARLQGRQVSVPRQRTRQVALRGRRVRRRSSRTRRPTASSARTSSGPMPGT